MIQSNILDIKIKKTKNSKINTLDWDNLVFGRAFSDHMFVMDYKDGKWCNAQISEFKDLNFSPATSVLHYGQTIFEGMKAYRNEDNSAILFRPEENAKRFNISAERMCMPEVPVPMFLEALKTLLDIDREWIPTKSGNSLYIRPFMIATDPYVGIRPSETYKFIIFSCPVGKYYTESVPVKIETKYSRAVSGGTGYAKAGGNYAGSLYPALLAQKDGYRQLIWTDAKEHKYIEEAGTMNVVFQIGNTLITPKSSDTILAGITRRSVLDIARDWGYKVEERKVTVKEIIDAIKNNSLVEAFGAGTAATIAQINLIHFDGIDYKLNDPSKSEFSNKLLAYLTSYKMGNEEDKFNWLVKF